MYGSTDMLQLVRSTITDIDSNKKLSQIIRTCIRIARLRNDWINLFWLQREIIDNTNEYERTRAFSELIPKFTKEDFDRYNKYFLEMWMKERPAIKINERFERENTDLIIAKGINSLECDLDYWEKTYQNANTPSGMHPVDLYFVDQENSRLRLMAQINIQHYQEIIENIKNRVYDFLCKTEKQILYGQVHADIFEKNREYVEHRLGQICPEVLEEFVLAMQSINIGTSGARAQALTSCRRILKELADVLYPPSNAPLIDKNGIEHDLSEERYINRLWQFVTEKTTNSTSSELLKATITDFGNRLDHLYELINKGIHNMVNDLEFDQCIIQAYILIGDLIRIFDGISAIEQ